jgi:hypothetical protein
MPYLCPRVWIGKPIMYIFGMKIPILGSILEMATNG